MLLLQGLLFCYFVVVSIVVSIVVVIRVIVVVIVVARFFVFARIVVFFVFLFVVVFYVDMLLSKQEGGNTKIQKGGGAKSGTNFGQNQRGQLCSQM